jgi:hypothetical protein
VGCRHHADDHIRILAAIVRGDLRQPRNAFDFKRSQAERRPIEKEWGLQELNSGNGTVARRATRAEQEKADRQKRSGWRAYARRERRLLGRGPPRRCRSGRWPACAI